MRSARYTVNGSIAQSTVCWRESTTWKMSPFAMCSLAASTASRKRCPSASGSAGGGAARRVSEGRRSQPRSCSKPSSTCCARSYSARLPGPASAISTSRCRTWSNATSER